METDDATTLGRAFIQDPHALYDEVIEWGIVRDQVDDALGGLNRHHHDLRVEHQQADQVSRGHE
jgi:hypothetical protein